ncbi:MAG: efflux transporter periplasmic adaptor subunit, partial [Pseudolabrys sp.]
MPTLRIFAASLVLALPALVVSRAQQPAIPTVNVITAEKRPVTESVRFVGRIQAIERVDIRARVT